MQKDTHKFQNASNAMARFMPSTAVDRPNHAVESFPYLYMTILLHQSIRILHCRRILPHRVLRKIGYAARTQISTSSKQDNLNRFDGQTNDTIVGHIYSDNVLRIGTSLIATVAVAIRPKTILERRRNAILKWPRQNENSKSPIYTMISNLLAKSSTIKL